MPPSKSSPFRLCVEGGDDKFVVVELVMRLLGRDWERDAESLPFIDDRAGISALLDRNELGARAKGYRRLGLVLDADDDVMLQWGKLCRALPSGLTLPSCPDPMGTVVDGLLPNSRFGVWVMPDNVHPGALEHLLRTLVHADDALWPHAEEATDAAPTHGAEFAPKSRDKAVLRAWLAWQVEPGVPPGRALRSNYFRGASPAATSFAAWFERLFLAP